jgi:catechol 2,3-dioxygenase-like lactoylglutathione lyase family enzyme
MILAMAEFQIPASKSKIRAVARLELEPRDFDETAKFYRRLGFTVTIKGTDVGGRFAELKAGEVRVRFTEAAATGTGSDRRRSAFHRLVLCFDVSDIAALVTELRGKGLTVEERGATAAEIVDPNGVRILLEQG